MVHNIFFNIYSKTAKTDSNFINLSFNILPSSQCNINKKYYLIRYLTAKKVNMFGNVEFIFPAVPFKVGVQHIVTLHKYLGKVTVLKN